MLADPGEQFDPRSELLASIAAYAAAPSDTPSATPPRPLTAPDVVAGLLADVADARAQLAGAPEVQLAACPLHDGQEHVQVRTWGNRMCVPALRGLDDGWRELEAEAQEMRAKLAETLVANQRWAETLGDVRQRHADVKRERDAHKLRADHYEGLWRAEHGLPPDGSDNLARDHDLADKVRAVIARYKADDVNALTAFADIMDAAGDTARSPAARGPDAATLEAAAPEDAEAETASILADPETMAAIAEGERDLHGEARDDA
jgi:hypothetical protein